MATILRFPSKTTTTTTTTESAPSWETIGHRDATEAGRRHLPSPNGFEPRRYREVVREYDAGFAAGMVARR